MDASINARGILRELYCDLSTHSCKRRKTTLKRTIIDMRLGLSDFCFQIRISCLANDGLEQNVRMHILIRPVVLHFFLF